MAASSLIRVGTRGSRLARVQTEWVLAQLRARGTAARYEVVVIQTAGDDDPQRRPARFAGKGLFTRDIERALLDGRIDLAVHSLKDLPTDASPALCLGAVPARENPWDALVGCGIERLSAGDAVRLGTSSLRRAAQLRRAFPACEVVEVRGNVDTRLRKVADGQADGAVLAAAGLRRLGLADQIAHLFTPHVMLPAPGQGALAVQIRADDAATRVLVQAIHCPVTAACVAAERAFMHALGGGCRAPVAALAELRDGCVVLAGRVLSADGSQCFDGDLTAPPAGADEAGQALAGRLIAAGADRVLDDRKAGPTHG